MSCRLVAALMVCALVVGCGDAAKTKSTQVDSKYVRARSDTSYRVSTAEKKADISEATPPAPGDVGEEPAPLPAKPLDREAYDHVEDNPFVRVATEPLSTFSIDVDTASYAITRRFLQQGRLPPKGAVRIEELVNYFDYRYAPPRDDHPFAVHVDAAICPWQPEHRLVRIGLKGREIEQAERPAANLVFLLDVSGSMNEPNKLPYVKESMKALVRNLTPRDRVAIVVYAGAAGLVLPSTSCDSPAPILTAIDRLSAGGSTAGGAGIKLAYDVARQNLVRGQVNRVILCTDGDFNVGVTSQSELVELIQQNSKSGVFLTVLGFGMGNLQDSTLEKLADKGNGNYGYIDTLGEAQKLLVDQLQGTLVTIAKDVKIQVEFNPAKVGAYRLIGYENRLLQAQDFNDDTKDAGEIGAGHTVTALYEIVPPGKERDLPGVDPLKYQKPAGEPVASDELLQVKLRYKEPEGETSRLLVVPLADESKAVTDTSADFRFAAAVACYGMLLRDSPHKGQATFKLATELAAAGLSDDPHGYRHGFAELLDEAKRLCAGREVRLK